MSETSLSLSRYDGPARIGGIDFAEVHLSEHAGTESGESRMGWEGTAEVTRSEAPGIGPEWAVKPGPLEVRLPHGGVGSANIRSLSLTDGTFWVVELLGVGPSPMA
ncbi:hypothetical protein [Streptomyces sp. NPDC026673]|uniref:hypothetical protein n=1 Tax=Streptomyces sp. NPDC026673 TaxID=3155724 RepID=UPI0033EC2C34